MFQNNFNVAAQGKEHRQFSSLKEKNVHDSLKMLSCGLVLCEDRTNALIADMTHTTWEMLDVVQRLRLLQSVLFINIPAV